MQKLRGPCQVNTFWLIICCYGITRICSKGTSQRFTAVRLPLVADSLVITSTNTTRRRGEGEMEVEGNGKRSDEEASQQEEERRRRAVIEGRFLLWGLTLSMVNDWLTVCNLRTTRIDLHPGEYPGPPTHITPKL